MRLAKNNFDYPEVPVDDPHMTVPSMYLKSSRPEVRTHIFLPATVFRPCHTFPGKLLGLVTCRDFLAYRTFLRAEKDLSESAHVSYLLDALYLRVYCVTFVPVAWGLTT